VNPTVRRSLWAIAATAATLRGMLVLGLELYGDEAYYWLWSRHPAAGYFDHPPMVAWLAGLSSGLFPGEAGLRLVFLVCGGLAVLFAGLAAAEVSDDPRAPVFASLLAASAPLLTLTGALALPDAPVEAAYSAATWLITRARGRRWLAAGAAVGLALLSKYNAALMAPALLLLVFWDPELRAELRRPWPWAGGAVAVAIFAPCLVWNARHDFLSIGFQLRHGFSRGTDPRTFAEFLLSQLLGAGPVALVMGFSLLLRPRHSAARRLAAVTLLPLVVTVWSAMRGRAEANWPVLVYPGLCAAAGAALARLRPAPARALTGASMAFGALLAIWYAVEVRHPWLLPPDSPAVERLHGWKEFTQRTREAAVRSCAALGDPPGCAGTGVVVFPVSYEVAGELAFYGGFGRFGSAYERPSQLDIWADQPAPGEPLLYVGWRDPQPPGPARYRAARSGPPVRFEVSFGGAVIREGSVTAHDGFAAAVPWPLPVR
jgi:4-amino-4-deoxy-L-arabinose transferase-like glycosyltransferase